MKKLIIAILVIVALAVLFVGCSDNNKNQPGATSPYMPTATYSPEGDMLNDPAGGGLQNDPAGGGLQNDPAGGGLNVPTASPNVNMDTAQ